MLIDETNSQLRRDAARAMRTEARRLRADAAQYHNSNKAEALVLDLRAKDLDKTADALDGGR